MNTTGIPKITLKDKIRWKLFPTRFCYLPETSIIYKDVVTIRSYTNLSLIDRLRVLITGRIATESKTVTENEVGNCTSKSVLYILPPKILECK